MLRIVYYTATLQYRTYRLSCRRGVAWRGTYKHINHHHHLRDRHRHRHRPRHHHHHHHHHQLWPAFVPACLSLACGLYLLAYKAYLDALRPKRTEATSSVTDRIMREDGGAGGVDRRPLLEEAAEREEDEFIAYPAPTS